MTANNRAELAANRRVGLAAVYLSVLALAVGVPEVLHLHGHPAAGPTVVASQSPAAPSSYYDSAGRQVLSV